MASVDKGLEEIPEGELASLRAHRTAATFPTKVVSRMLQ
jgi:hypothetical protein